MTSRSPNSWTKPAIRVAAAGFGVALAGPLGGALGGWLGAALGGEPAAHLVEKYAEKFGDSAAEKLLDIGADSLVESLKESAPDLAQAYRDALRQSLADVHREVRGGLPRFRAPEGHGLRLDAAKIDDIALRVLLKRIQGPPRHTDWTRQKMQLRCLPVALQSNKASQT